MAHFDRLDVVPLLGAIVRCHGKVPLLGAMVGAIAGCHCWMRLLLLLWAKEMLSFFSFKLHTFTHKVNGSAYYKVGFLVLLFISWSVVSCPPGIYSAVICAALCCGRPAPAPVRGQLPATAAA